ncbi:MAG: hypothetical protein R3324_11175 [Halobacteriales archaeon]|nr:hypothetical protein [Halobacteriales archaeon]
MNESAPTAVQYGVGPIGIRVVEVAVDRGYEFVGAVDIDPDKVGDDLGRAVGLGRNLGATVTDDEAAVLGHEPDVVFHSTGSALEAVADQLEAAMAAGADVVSTAEELSYPWHGHHDTAVRLAETATDHGVTCLGTGINPGFAMDTLPAVLTTACRTVEAVHVTRVQDAATRRRPLQEKIGAGTDVDTFETEIAPKAGHVGLPESIAMVAGGLGWELEGIEETVEPVVAEKPVESAHLSVEAGEVAGIHQVGVGTVDGRDAVTLDLSMYLGAPDPVDRVRIMGEPDLDVTATGGFHGDVTTPAIVVNVVPRVREAEPGLATMLDIATPRFASPP